MLFRYATIAYAISLSLACLAWGAVYDLTIVPLLIFSLLILFSVENSSPSLPPSLLKFGTVIFFGLGSIIALQWLLLPVENHFSDLQNFKITSFDKNHWLESIGRFLLLMIAYFVALNISSSRADVRVFFSSLLISGVIFVGSTFFLQMHLSSETKPGLFSHGFVNPNNAATYLGTMLLLTVAESCRFFRKLSKRAGGTFIGCIDTLNIPTVCKALFLIFAFNLFMSGLLLTGSRAGILLSLLCLIVFIGIFLVKHRGASPSKSISWRSISFATLLLSLFFFGVVNFGHVFEKAINAQGFDPDARPQVFKVIVPMIKDRPLLGSGLGSFPKIFQQYRPETISPEGLYDKAHNTYLELGVELGLIALVLVISAMLMLGYFLYCSIRVSSKSYTTPIAGFCIWLLVCLHSLVDFPLQIPGLAALVLVILTVSASKSERSLSHYRHSSKKRLHRTSA